MRSTLITATGGGIVRQQAIATPVLLPKSARPIFLTPTGAMLLRAISRVSTSGVLPIDPDAARIAHIKRMAAAWVDNRELARRKRPIKIRQWGEPEEEEEDENPVMPTRWPTFPNEMPR